MVTYSFGTRHLHLKMSHLESEHSVAKTFYRGWTLECVQTSRLAPFSVDKQERTDVPAIDVACARSLVSVHAFGPPGAGLSGISLHSGADASDLRPSRYVQWCKSCNLFRHWISLPPPPFPGPCRYVQPQSVEMLG